MPNSYESREPLFQNNGERLFLRHCIVIYHCTQLSNDYFLPGASICTRVRPDAPSFAPALLKLADALSFYVTMPYTPKKENPRSPLITRDFEDCTQKCDCIKYRVLIFDTTLFMIQSQLLHFCRGAFQKVIVGKV